MLETFSDRVFSRKKLMGESLVHKGDVPASLSVILIKHTARDQTRPRGSEIINRDTVPRRKRNIGGARNWLSFDEDAAVVPLQRERKTVDQRGGFDSGHRAYLVKHPLLELARTRLIVTLQLEVVA